MKNEKKTFKENTFCIMLAFLTGISLCIRNDIYVPNEAQMQKLVGRWDTFFWKADASFQQTTYLLFLVSILLFFAFKYLNQKLKKENLKWYIPLSAVFSLMLLLCDSYHKYYSWDGVFGSISTMLFSVLKGVGIAVMFVYLLDLLYRFSINSDTDWSVQYGKKDKKMVILKYTLLFLVLWIPYMIIFFSGCMNADTRDQFAQILGNRDYCWTARTIILENENVILNNHHPVFYTMILGVFVKLGDLLGGAYHWAFEIYCILQSVLFAFTLACQTYYLDWKFRNKTFHFALLAFFGLNPIFPIWGMTVMKDVLFSILLWWTVVLLYEMLKYQMTTKKLIVFSIIIFLMCLVRNNGIYICLALSIFLCMYLWKNKSKLVQIGSVMLIVLLLFQVGVQGFLFSAFDISQGSPREMLSVPFMQTVRYVRDHREEISAEEEELLLTLFHTPNDSLDDLVAKYNETPDKSDNVKEMYYKGTTGDTLKEYFKFWMEGLLKYPSCYIQAFLCLNYSWFSFESHHDNRHYKGVDNQIKELLPGVESPESLREARNIVGSGINVLAKIPFTSWLVEFSFYTWAYLLIFILLVVKKRKAALVAMSTLYLNYLICFIGPVAYMRYALPALVCFPTLILFTFGREEENEENSSFNPMLQ